MIKIIEVSEGHRRDLIDYHKKYNSLEDLFIIYYHYNRFQNELLNKISDLREGLDVGHFDKEEFIYNVDDVIDNYRETKVQVKQNYEKENL